MENAHNQRTLKHTCTHSFVPWKPMGAPSDISEYYRTSETSPEPLRPYCTSSISDRPFHLLSSSLLLLTQALLFFSTLCLPPSFPPSTVAFPSPSTFFTPSFHLFLPSTSPLSSFALSSSASVLGASRIFPWFRFSFPSSIALLSPLPRWCLRPLARFLPSSFHHSIPFLSLAFSTLRFHSVLPWGFQGGLKRS